MERLWRTAIITITIRVIITVAIITVVIIGAISIDCLRNISNMKKTKP